MHCIWVDAFVRENQWLKSQCRTNIHYRQALSVIPFELNSSTTIKITFSGQNNFFREVLEPDISFCNVCFWIPVCLSFFSGIKIISRLSASAVYILTPGYQFIQRGFNCRANIRPETGCFGYYTVGLCLSLPFMY